MHVGPVARRMGLRSLGAICAIAVATGAAAHAAQAKKPAPAKPKKPTAAPAKKAADDRVMVDSATPAKTAGDAASAAAGKDWSVGDLYTHFLHSIKVGKFERANHFAAALLAHPEAKPVKLLELSEQDPESLRIITIILSNQAVGENARKVLDRINEGRKIRRRDPDRIKADILALGGEPQQVMNATQRLQWSGEYAVQWMIAALKDDSLKSLHPRIVKTLPKIGLGAVTPLAMALRTENQVIKLIAIEALGKLGYPHALPYLKEVVEDEKAGENLRIAAKGAMSRIAPAGSQVEVPAAILFYTLANQYYANEGSLRADPREDEANVWYWRDGWVKSERVPRQIFDEIMAMRCCEEALLHQPDHDGSLALWLAANFRREVQLGVEDVASEQPDKVLAADVTRPKDYPRAIYFARSAGPHFNHMVLSRALDDKDSGVALGAIRALAETAGESSLIGKEDVKQPLVVALDYRDAVVRVQAALALGRALPKTKFAGSQEVIPVLSQALGLTGQKYALVVEPDAKALNKVMALLRASNCQAVGESSFGKALDRAEKELPTLDVVFLASDISQPDLRGALDALRARPGGRNLPIVLLAKGPQRTLVDQISREDPATGMVAAQADSAALLRAWAEVNRNVGRAEMDPDLALDLALSAAETLREIAVSGTRVFDIGRAEGALIAALKHPSPDLRVLSAQALAMIATGSSQQAIATQALDEGNDVGLRIDMFAALAESGRHHGNKLSEAQLNALIKLVMEAKDLAIRTAASQAFGALNVPGNRASEIIRAQYKG